MELLVVGTVAFDTVETPFGKRDRTLGGSATFISNAASYFCKARMVGVVGTDFPDEHIQFLKRRHIDTDGIAVLDGKTFFWRGFYDTDLGVAKTQETQLNVLQQFDPHVPPACRGAEVVALGNIDPRLQLKVLEQLDGPKLVAADTMNFWIEGDPDGLRRTLKHVDLLSINDAEARQLSGEYNLVKAAQAIHTMGPRILVIKRGEHGATVYSENEIFMAPAFPIMTITDPTGAGDSFAGGMLGYLAQQGRFDNATIRQAVILGSTMASYAVEDFSLDRFRILSKEDIKNRFIQFTTLTQFEGTGVEVSGG